MKKRKRGAPVVQEKAGVENEPITVEESGQPGLEAEIIEEKEGAKGADLESKIIKLEKERTEANDKYLRTLAEFENFRRRTVQERVNWIKNANEGLILKMCDVLDDFERAFENHPEADRSDHLYQGMEAIYRKLQGIMKTEGVTKIETEAMDFDPMYHDAITYTPSDLKKDRIVSVIQNGYIMNNKVIRPAKVVLSSGEVLPGEERSDDNEGNFGE